MVIVFFSLPVWQLQHKLNALEWIDQADIARIWPDTLKITLTEKRPIAYWNEAMITADGVLLLKDSQVMDKNLPILNGPEQDSQYVLQIYKKLSKLLLDFDMQMSGMRLYKNSAWEIKLTNGVELQLGEKIFKETIAAIL